MNMRILKFIMICLILGGLAIPILSCGSEPAADTENQIVTVQRGNLTVDITAVGNLALSVKEDLAFEISGTAQEPLTVEEILVEEGDSVTEGQVIARLDTTTLEDAIETQQEAVKRAEDAVYTAELSVRTAQINLDTAEYEYKKIVYPYDYYTYSLDVPESMSYIESAEQQLKEAMKLLESAPTQEQYLEAKEKVRQAQDDLENAGKYLNRGNKWEAFKETQEKVINEVVVTTESFPSTFLDQVRAAQIKIDSSQISLDRALKDVDQARSDLDKAKENVDEAREKLDKAVIVAPFDGFITTVNVAGGDEVARGTVAAVIADPDRFEAELTVSEMDISQVKLGGEARVQVDAMSGLTLPARVTHVSPTATIQQGVVNYTVRVELESLEAVVQERQEARQAAVENIARGELPQPLQQAIEEGRITREQVEEMIQQRQQGQGSQQVQVTAMATEEFQLREGLTATVSIIVEERDDVLLVPYTAITTRGPQTSVNIVSEGGVAEERSIKTGITDYQYTEVIEGLSEGEEVLVPQRTSTTGTTQQVPRQGGAMFFGPGPR